MRGAALLPAFALLQACVGANVPQAPTPRALLVTRAILPHCLIYCRVILELSQAEGAASSVAAGDIDDGSSSCRSR